MSLTPINPARMRRQAVASMWLMTSLVLGGIAWTLGLQATWWERVLQALPLLFLAVMDLRGVQVVESARVGLTRVLAMLGWIQIPLALAGGAWWCGVHTMLAARILLIASLAVVIALVRYAPSAPAVDGGAG